MKTNINKSKIIHTLIMNMKVLTILIFMLISILSKNLYAIESRFINNNGDTVISVNADIRLSDVFRNIPSHLDRILGNAPEPGTQIILTKSDFKNIINRYSLPKNTQFTKYSLIINHKMVIIGHETVEKHIKNALLPSLKEHKNIEVKIKSNNQIVIPSGYKLSNSVKIISLNKQRKTYKIVLSGVSTSGDIYNLDEIQGYYTPIIKVSLIKSSLSSGQIINKNNLVERWVPANKVKSNNIITSIDLVGKRTRRQLLTGSIVKSGDIKVAILVKRGDEVTVEYRTQNMALTARMKAKEQGAKGDIIKLQAKNKIIEGRVVGIGYVVISSSTR